MPLLHSHTCTPTLTLTHKPSKPCWAAFSHIVIS